MIGAIFPGQGSQHVGMGRFLVENFKLPAKRFDEASELLHLDCRKLCFSGSESDLQLTENTQPLLVLTSVATYEVLRETCGLNCAAFAGHSVGEYSALVCAGALAFADAIRAVRIRGRAMQTASPAGEGGMCAVIGLEDLQVRELCEWVEKESGQTPLSPANFNAPGQVVVSGRRTAIEWMTANFKRDVVFPNLSARVKFIPLKVSAPFHCSLMAPAEAKMREVLTAMTFQAATTPVVQNFSAKMNREPNELREQLIRQVTAPVLWTACMRTMLANGNVRFVECGPGRVLAGLTRRFVDLGASSALIDPEKITVWNINSLEDIHAVESGLKN